MEKKQKPDFKKNLYVIIEQDGDDVYYIAHASPEDTSNNVDTAVIAKYELVGLYTAKRTTTLEKI